MKGDTKKCQLKLSTGDSNQIQIENSLIKHSLCEKLLGVKFDYKLTFDQRVKSLGKKANAKLKVSACRIPSALTLSLIFIDILGLVRLKIRYLVFVIFNYVLCLCILLT